MMLGVCIIAMVGVLLMTFGYLIWKKEKISLLHDYHYNHVLEEDKNAFCSLSGKGLLVIGVGLLITAVLFGVTQSLWSFMALVVGFTSGIALLIIAGKRYNTK